MENINQVFVAIDQINVFVEQLLFLLIDSQTPEEFDLHSVSGSDAITFFKKFYRVQRRASEGVSSSLEPSLPTMQLNVRL